MSTQSTPRSTRSASVDASPAHLLTPGQKIKAMLAQFDSDSEAENTTTTSATRPIAPPIFTTGVSKSNIVAALDEDDEDDDITILAPKGRMAARMLGLEDTESSNSSKPNPQSETAYERVAKTIHQPPSEDETASDGQPMNKDQPSEDDIHNAAPARRRLLNAKEHQLNTTTESNESPNRRSQRSESPLFVEEDSETESRAENNTSTEEPKNARFLALVQQKQKERKERERIEAAKKAARAEKMKEFNSDVVAADESDEDSESAKQLTQPSRPARKASKKALEEMARETQRLSRNRQLTYQPRVKRKITIDSFVALMNSHKSEQPSEMIDSASSSSAPSSDADGNKQKETPPTSPAEISLDEGKAIEVQPSESPQKVISKATKVSNEPRAKVRLSREEVAKRQNEEPDDDLEIITSPGRSRKTAIFENFRSKNSSESKAMFKLRLLARLTSPSRRTKSMSPAELAIMLQLKARQQALQERQERVEELRARGIVIETAEEREAMEADVEDLMEKARQEADAIARREKAARDKKSGDGDDDEEDEEDYDYLLSGSEDEEEDGMEDDVESDAEGGDGEEELEVETDRPVQDLVDNKADEESGSDQEPEDSSHEDEQTLTHSVRDRRRRRVVSDDEEDELKEAQSTTTAQEPKTPAKSIAGSVGSAQRPQFPDMPGTSAFTMSLTQAFAGTIADNQSEDEEDSFKVLQSLPDPGLPNLQNMAIDSQVMVKDSQDQRRRSIDLFAGYTQSNARVSESPGPNWSQLSQMPEPTQDIGFIYSPIDVSKRFVEPPVSTIDTVILPESGSPVMRKKGRLLQRGRPALLSDDEGGDFEIKASAFDVMKKSKQRTKSAAFDKSNSKAKEHIDEAAEESEDEYAGLGGASDDDNGEEDELDREMINDNSGEVVDEKELAALNANHQRAMDEKQVSKLLKDITTGALRRRRGADDDLDLDDSDDERMAQRRAKQREFAKMRKALLADEKVSEIASNPKKQAFFKALEDRDDDDEMDFEFDNGVSAEDASVQDTRNEEQSAAGAGGESEGASHKRKRPLQPAAEESSNRPPPHLRRTAAGVSRKPSSLAEIRETLSFLTATPEYDSFHEDAAIDEEIVYSTDKRNSDDENENKAEPSRKSSTDGFAIPPNPRRTRGQVVDRLALRRATSSNSAYANAKPAFVTSKSSWDTANAGFRAPPLLRRATSSWSTTDSSSSSTFSTTGAKKSSAAGPKAALSNPNKGSVNYYTAARERERERDLRLKERGGSKITAAKIAQLQKKSLENGLMAWSKKESGFGV